MYIFCLYIFIYINKLIVETDTEPVRQTAVGNIFNFTKGDRPGFQLTPDINIPPQYMIMAFEVFLIASLIMGFSSTSSDDLQLNADCVRLLDQTTIREKFPILAQSCEKRINGRGVILDFILRLLVVGAVRYGLLLFEKFVSHFF